MIGLRKLSRSKKVWIKYNPSRTELRYIIVRSENRLTTLLVEADHKHAIAVEGTEVASYFRHDFDSYFDQGHPISEIFEAVKDIEEPDLMNKEIFQRLKTARNI